MKEYHEIKEEYHENEYTLPSTIVSYSIFIVRDCKERKDEGDRRDFVLLQPTLASMWGVLSLCGLEK